MKTKNYIKLSSLNSSEMNELKGGKEINIKDIIAQPMYGVKPMYGIPIVVCYGIPDPDGKTNCIDNTQHLA